MHKGTDGNEEGTVFSLSEEEYIGKIPVRQDITVLPADDPKNKLIGPIIYEGSEIFKISDYAKRKMTEEELVNRDHWPKYKNGKYRYHKALKNKDDIKVGDEILVYFWNPIYKRAVIDEFEHKDELYASHSDGSYPHSFWSLSFSSDNRECWICTGYCAVNPNIWNAELVNFGSIKGRRHFIKD